MKWAQENKLLHQRHSVCINLVPKIWAVFSLAILLDNFTIQVRFSYVSTQTLYREKTNWPLQEKNSLAHTYVTRMNHLVAHIVDVAERKQYWKILFHLYTFKCLKSTFRKAQLGQICFFCYNLIECLNQHWRGNRLQTIYDPQFSFNFRHTAEIYCYCFVRNLVSVNSFTNTICFNIWNPESPRNCQLNTILFCDSLQSCFFFINKCFTDRWVYNTFNIIRFYMMGLYINLMLFSWWNKYKSNLQEFHFMFFIASCRSQ